MARFTGNHIPGLMSNASQELDSFAAPGGRHPLRRLVAGCGLYPCGEGRVAEDGTWGSRRRSVSKGLREVSDFVHSQGSSRSSWFEPERPAPAPGSTRSTGMAARRGRRMKLLESRQRDGPPVADGSHRPIADRAGDRPSTDRLQLSTPCILGPTTHRRQGITEIRMSRVSAFWDELKRRHPGLLVIHVPAAGDATILKRSDGSAPVAEATGTTRPTANEVRLTACRCGFRSRGPGHLPEG